MPSTINADNGVSSGSAGLKSSADSSGVLSLQTNGTTAVTVDTSQRVGIGTSSPTQKLDVTGAIKCSSGNLIGSDENYFYQSASNTLTLRVGTSADTSYLNFKGVGGMPVLDGPGGVLGFATIGSERMRIDSSGNLTISSGKIVSNASPSTPTLDVAGNTLTYANNATVDFPLFSGMIIVNTQTSGDVSVYLCGAGAVSRIGTSTGTSTGTVTFVSGIGGYRWTNNSGGSVVASFASIRTRAFA